MFSSQVFYEYHINKAEYPGQAAIKPIIKKKRLKKVLRRLKYFKKEFQKNIDI